MWYTSGILAELCIKILMCNFILSLLHVVDPLCAHGGQVEVDPTVLLPCAEEAHPPGSGGRARQGQVQGQRNSDGGAEAGEGGRGSTVACAPTSGPPAIDAAVVQAMLRLRGLRSLVLWGSLTCAGLGNLVYASSLGSSTPGTLAFDLPTAVVVGIAGALLVGTALYWSGCRRGCAWGRPHTAHTAPQGITEPEKAREQDFTLV